MKTIIFIAVALMMGSVSVAQYNSKAEQLERKQQQEKAAIQEAVKDSPTAKELRMKVDAREPGVILKAAVTGDQSLIPYLRLVAAKENRTNQNSPAFEAHAALAKLGDDKAFAEIVTETKSRNPYVQDTAIKKLAVAGTKKTFQKLYELLDDTVQRNPDPPVSNDEVFTTNNSLTVMWELAEVVDDPPVRKNKVPSLDDIQLWKKWFEKNKHLIE